MKNIKYVFFLVLFLFINIFSVEASCTDEEIESLKDLAKDIKITYKHKGRVETEDGVFYNLFDVRVKNINDDMYVSLIDGYSILKPVDGEIVETFNNGTWNFDIYSNKCEEKIDTIEVYIPRFNMYSLDPLCEGIDGDDFALCGKYYEYDVDYDNFIARVNHYRATHKVNTETENNETRNSIAIIFQNILNFIIQYQLYIIVGLAIVLIILIVIIVIKRKKKRGVLE